MQLGKSVKFINLLIHQTKERKISWVPLNSIYCEQSFPQLESVSSFYCETNNAIIAIGMLVPQVQMGEGSFNIDIFIRIRGSRAYSLFEDTEISDAQDDDFFCSKLYRLYNLINSSGNLLEKFIDDYLGNKNQ